MLNVEKYKEEIKELNYEFGKNGDKLFNCEVDVDKCDKCDFGLDCEIEKIKWLMEEYQEPPLLNDKEKEIIKTLVILYSSNYKVDESNILVIAYDDGAIAIAELCNDTCNMLIRLNHSSDDFKNLVEFRSYTLEELGL